MLSDKMQKAFDEQINKEFASAHIYLAMEAYFQSVNLVGAANWMRVQFQEEEFHALKMFDFVHERDGQVKLLAMEAPPAAYKSPLAAFEAVLAHERKVTASIHALLDLAVAESDHPTQSFLKWFVDEQVEEESNANAIIQKLKLVGDSGAGLFMIDQELATRVFTPPAAPA
ncbi:MAG: ferritin [Gemmatimonadota bacterium]